MFLTLLTHCVSPTDSPEIMHFVTVVTVEAIPVEMEISIIPG